nr:MAG: hypothetical protein AM324_16090 [Candidatus Thorarchaeota archaeon SMTZ1-83]
MKSSFLREFLMSLESFGTLYGPKHQNGILTYGPITKYDDLVLDGENTLIPLKKLFHPRIIQSLRSE